MSRGDRGNSGVFTNPERCRGHRPYQRRHAQPPRSRTTAAVLAEGIPWFERVHRESVSGRLATLRSVVRASIRTPEALAVLVANGRF